MEVRYGICRRMTCADDCPAKVRSKKCLSSGISQLEEAGNHASGPRSQDNIRKLPADLKAFVLSNIEKRPFHIKLKLENQLPQYKDVELKQIQNICFRLRKELLGNQVEAVMNYLDDHKYVSRSAEDRVYTFGPSMHGTYDETERFVVGVTSGKMLRKLRVEETQQGMLHMDTTYSVNSKGFPITAFGISDRYGKLHVIALFLSDCEDQEAYNMMLEAIICEFPKWMRGFIWNPEFVVTDGAPFFPSLVRERFPSAVHIMCWFHLLQSCRRWNQAHRACEWQSVVTQIKNLHMCLNVDEYQEMLQTVYQAWEVIPEFRDYFFCQWGPQSNFPNW
jgi:hypothetical protein